MPRNFVLHTERIHQDDEHLLHAGVAKVDITPENPIGIYMSGFGPKKKAEGVKHPLFARALILERGDFRCAIVALPLTGLLNDVVDDIKAHIATSLVQSNHLILACTHSHAAPDTVGFWGKLFSDGKDPTYMNQLKRGIIEALTQASQNMHPAEVGYSKASFNPDQFVGNSNIANLVDPEVVVLNLRHATSHKPLATLFELACHPEAARKWNKYLTPDFPHYALLKVEEAFPGTTGLYISGALGAMMSPRKIDRDEVPEGDYPKLWKFVERIGTRLAEASIDAVHNIPRYETSPEMGVWRMPMYIQNTNPLYKLLRGREISKRPVFANRKYLTFKQYYRTEVNLWKIDDFRLACIPGELTPDLGLRVKKQSGGSVTMLAGLANDELGYLLPQNEWMMRYYKYEKLLSVNKLAGERVRYNLETLGEMSTSPIPGTNN